MHPLKEMIKKRLQDKNCGIASYCSANELVLEMSLREPRKQIPRYL